MTVTKKPLTWFKVNPQVRKQFSEQELRQLGESLKVRQLQPALALQDGTLIAGERRYRAAFLVGLETLEVQIVEDRPDASETTIWQLTENIHREDLTGFEKWHAAAELMRLNPQWALKDLAGHLHLGAPAITKILSPSKCSVAWQEALTVGKVTTGDCYAASGLSESQQAELLQMKLSGASRDQIAQEGRKKRSEDKPTVRVNKVRCVLSSGVNVVVSGEGVSLEESIEALGEAIKEMKRARDLGYTAKTFAAAMKDRATKPT